VITYRGEQFDGCNKPKRTPNHHNNSRAVLAKGKMSAAWWASTTKWLVIGVLLTVSL